MSRSIQPPVFTLPNSSGNSGINMDEIFNQNILDHNNLNSSSSSGSSSKIRTSAESGVGESTSAPRAKKSKKDMNLTEDQMRERRERNREHAKRSRVRKRFLLESLSKSVKALETENDLLKKRIVENLPDGDKIIDDLHKEQSNCIASGVGFATRTLDSPDYSLVKALQTAQQNFVITDPSLPDNPIVYASEGFLELTGYTRNQVLGRNCRFLQGPETDPRAVDKIRKGIESGEDTTVVLLNYCMDGTKFWNQFFVATLRDGDGKVMNHLGVQCRVSQDYAEAFLNG